MAQKQLRTAPRQRAALGFVKATSPDISEYSASLFSRQAEIDPVVILAARARVAVPTMRLHAELFGIGGAHG